jgi:tetratricopeptide (TPR) repeat protein/tRNA A-37 threonylcarbamoyl transferase component Bud32
VFVEEAMHPAPEPGRSPPASQAVPETGLTAPHVPESSSSASAPASTGLEAPAPAPPPVADGLPAQVGRYHIEGELGRGGMGIVLRAQDSAFHRTLAIKMLREAHPDQPQQKQRFLEEAQVLGQLQHPGIPPVHDRGELPDGRPYFAMKLIKGRTLAELLNERPDPAHDLPRFLAIFGQVCQAVAYAHSRGILHRDLKPSNVMVGAFGEVQVMDWGLAKVLGSEQRLKTGIRAEDTSTVATVRTEEDDLATQEGAVMGTPAYMAPEQALGEIERLDERADVFGLGAILCVLLTGKPPYVAPSKAELYRRAKHGELAEAHARLEGCGADAELVRLAKGCLAPDLAERPRHAGLVAEAITAYQALVQERLQQAEVQHARTEVQVAEERKRRRVTLALLVSLLVLVSGGAAFALWYQHQQAAAEAAQRQRDQERALQRAKAQQGVELALQEAHTHGTQARQLTSRPDAWQTTLAAAQFAVTRAEKLLEQEPELAQAELVQRVRQVKAELGADEKDRKILAAFDRVREEQSQIDPSGRNLNLAAAHPRLMQALAEYGLAPGALPAEQAAALLRQRPREVQEQLMGLLQECWYWAPPKEAEAESWLAALLAQADGDPWRQKVRQVAAHQQWQALDKLLQTPEAARQTAVFVVWLGRVLPAEARVRLLRQAQLQYPSDFWVNFGLGGALNDTVVRRGEDSVIRQEDLPLVAEIVSCYKAARALRPHSPAVNVTLGTALQDQGDLKGAITCYRKALDLNPKLAYTHNNLGNALQAEGDLKGAIASYHKVLELNPKYAPAHTNLGNALQAEGDVKGAIACYTKALELDPKLAAAHNSLGLALKAQGDPAGAIACYTKALDLDPKLAPAHNNLGLVLYDQGDLKGAIASYTKALELNPKYAPAHTNLGNALYAQGDVKGAIECYRKAIQFAPRLALAHLNLGAALAAQGDVKGAITCCRKAIALDPKYAPAHTNLGAALAEQGDVKGAIASYTKALDLDPKDVKAHCNLGAALAAQGDLKGGIACFQKALELNPNYAEAHTNLGLALKAQGDPAGAIACYRKALELDPKLAAAHNSLGAALQAQGEVKGATACYRQAIALDPKYAPAHYNLGDALYDQGDVKGAIVSYTKALDLDPKLFRAHGALGQALLAQGEFTTARAATKKALDLLPAGHPLRPLVTRQWQDCQRLLDLDVRLPALLKGEDQPKDTAEQLALADLCQRYKKRYAAAARFYVDAFAAGAAQSSQRAYNAACAAALAAAGKGIDADNIEPKEKVRLRQQALTWLRDNLEENAKQLEDADAKTRKAVQQTLQHWQKDADLGSVRGKEALAQLPAAERAAWQQLWADVEKLLKKDAP